MQKNAKKKRTVRINSTVKYKMFAFKIRLCFDGALCSVFSLVSDIFASKKCFKGKRIFKIRKIIL